MSRSRTNSCSTHGLRSRMVGLNGFGLAHDLTDVENGTAIVDGETLFFGGYRPDILQVQPSAPE